VVVAKEAICQRLRTAVTVRYPDGFCEVHAGVLTSPREKSTGAGFGALGSESLPKSPLK